MQEQISWWFIDQERAALVNPSTKQCVRWVAKEIDDVELGLCATPHRSWMQFEYEDPECIYPILVEWRNNPQTPGKSITWRIDHVRSGRLWARQNPGKAEFPPYGLWRRADIAVSDALSCWPSMGATGPAPHAIWINGGWFNGKPTDKFYRFLSPSSKSMRSRWLVWVPPLDAQVPSPWEIVGQTELQDRVVRGWLSKLRGKTSDRRSIEEILARSPIVGLPDKAYCGPHLRSRDDSRALIPIEYLSSQRDEEESTLRIRLLYIDQDLICDCLTLTRQGSRGAQSVNRGWRSTFDHSVSRIGHGGIVPRDSYAGPSYFPHYWVDRETVLPRAELWYRFAHAVTEAWLQWEDTSVTLPRRGSSDQVQVTIPAAIRVRLPVVASTGCILSGDVADSLDSPIAGGRPIALDDSSEKAPATVAKRNMGWWHVDGDVITNVVSDQHFRLVETSGAETWNSSNLWFRYSDHDIAYPVFVRRRLTASSGTVSGVWEVDHQLSAERWRMDANAGAAAPPFGLWRRVDDAITDALLCWRELEPLTHSMHVRSIGGWWNGAWRPDWQREWSGIGDRFPKNERSLAAPVLEALNAVAPSPWVFIECAKDVVRLELAHTTRLPNGLAFLPPDAPFEGFQGHTSYLIRADNSAVLFPAHATGRWSYRSYPDVEDYYVGVGHFTYANEHEFLTCAFDDESKAFVTDKAAAVGSRSSTDTGCLANRLEKESSAVLTRAACFPICRRLIFDLIQAWPNWRGTGSWLREDPGRFSSSGHFGPPPKHKALKWERSGIRLETPKVVRVMGGYVGGLYVRELRTTSNIPVLGRSFGLTEPPR